MRRVGGVSRPTYIRRVGRPGFVGTALVDGGVASCFMAVFVSLGWPCRAEPQRASEISFIDVSEAPETTSKSHSWALCGFGTGRRYYISRPVVSSRLNKSPRSSASSSAQTVGASFALFRNALGMELYVSAVLFRTRGSRGLDMRRLPVRRRQSTATHGSGHSRESQA